MKCPFCKITLVKDKNRGENFLMCLNQSGFSNEKYHYKYLGSNCGAEVLINPNYYIWIQPQNNITALYEFNGHRYNFIYSIPVVFSFEDLEQISPDKLLNKIKLLTTYK